jgi:hypothetical protein
MLGVSHRVHPFFASANHFSANQQLNLYEKICLQRAIAIRKPESQQLIRHLLKRYGTLDSEALFVWLLAVLVYA